MNITKLFDNFMTSNGNILLPNNSFLNITLSPYLYKNKKTNKILDIFLPLKDLNDFEYKNKNDFVKYYLKKLNNQYVYINDTNDIIRIPEMKLICINEIKEIVNDSENYNPLKYIYPLIQLKKEYTNYLENIEKIFADRKNINFKKKHIINKIPPEFKDLSLSGKTYSAKFCSKEYTKNIMKILDKNKWWYPPETDIFNLKSENYRNEILITYNMMLILERIKSIIMYITSMIDKDSNVSEMILRNFCDIVKDNIIYCINNRDILEDKLLRFSELYLIKDRIIDAYINYKKSYIKCNGYVIAKSKDDNKWNIFFYIFQFLE